SGTGCRLAFAVAAFAPSAAVLAAALVDVGQQRELARALDRAGDLDLVAAAGAGDAARADLALLGDELAQGRDVLVVDLLDLVAALLARLAPPAPRTALLVAPAHRLAASACLGHQRTGPRLRRCSGEWADVAGKGTSLERDVVVAGRAGGRCGLEVPFIDGD